MDMYQRIERDHPDDDQLRGHHHHHHHHRHHFIKDYLGLIFGIFFALLALEIKREVRKIEKKLDNPAFGLEEIKLEIIDIENKLDNPAFGLEEIKREIRDIENKLDNPDFGLEEIKREIRDIENKLDNPDFGLEEIKREIKAIEDGTAGSSVLTTGPVVMSSGVNTLYVKILNNTSETQSVRITVFNIDECAKVPEAQVTVDVLSKCSNLQTFDLGDLDIEREFEVQIEFLSGATKGIYAYVAGAQGGSFNLDPANVFRHEELVPQLDP